MKIHPNEFLLEEFLLSCSREHREIVEHLTRCARCRRRFYDLMRHRPGKAVRKLADVLQWSRRPTHYSAVSKDTERMFQSREEAVVKERVEAPGLYAELTNAPREQWNLLLQNCSRFHTWGVYELLVERSLEMAIRDPVHAEDLGFMALRLSEYLDAEYYGAELIEDLRARAWAHTGNARRVRSDLQGAEEAFANAQSHLKKGTRDPLERAVLLDLKASLRRCQRRFDEAFGLLRRAHSIFLKNGQQHRAGRALVNLSTVHHYAGDPERGIPLLYQAIELIDLKQEPRLLLCARHNLIDYLAESGRYLEAQKLYRETRLLYRDFPDAWTQNRRKWVKGKIARGLGQSDEAESLFRAAREGFIDEGIPYDAALVSLELGTLYTQQARVDELKRLAEEIVPIFFSLHIPREALAALTYLQQAARRTGYTSTART